MAVNINVPSQVKTYANLAAFPATGALKTIYIAEDTNKTYRWTGSVYVEVSASAASGITIGSTAIASGSVGRILFEGAGNVVQQSSSLFWDATNNRLGIGTSTPSFPLDVVGASRISGTLTTGGGTPLVLTGESFAFQTVVASGAGGSVFGTNSANPSFIDILSGSNFWHISNRSTTMGNRLGFFNANFTGTTATYTNELFTINTNGNIGINTTFDAGFRLDVNGTARVQGQLTTTTANAQFGAIGAATGNFRIDGVNGAGYAFSVYSSNTLRFGVVGFGGIDMPNGFNVVTGSTDLTTTRLRVGTGNATAPLNIGAQSGSTDTIALFASNGVNQFNIKHSTGNVLINTTTDAGFRLDVNGTARFQSDVTVANSLMKMYVTGGVIRFEQQGGAGFPIAFMQNGSFYQYIDQATLNIAFRNDYSFVMTTGNTSTINASAKMQIDSTTRGFLPPRMTTTQKNAIASPAAGLMVYDTTLNVISYYNGTMWI